MEASMKVYVMRETYFKYGFNVFDFTVILLTWIGILLEILHVFENIGTIVSILRIFRLLKVFNQIKRIKSLGVLFNTFIRSLPPLGNIMLIFGLILSIYAIIGREFFAYIMFSDNRLTLSLNFTTFFKSVYTLYIAATGQGFPGILRGLIAEREPNYACMEINNFEDYHKYGKFEIPLTA